MPKIIEAKHPLAIRWNHWINFPVLGLMIWTGILIYWANDVNTITIFGHTLFYIRNMQDSDQGISRIHFLPDGFYHGFFTDPKYDNKWYSDFLTIEHRLPDGMALHFFFMWFFVINGIAYVLYTAISGEWRYLIPNKESFKEAIQVVLYDLKISKNEPPRRKFNGAQQIAYTSVIVMGLLSTLTGLAIYKPAQLGWLTQMLGGYVPARFEHFWLMIGFVLFFLIHISQVIRAGWNNFRSMVTGYEVVSVNAPDPAAGKVA